MKGDTPLTPEGNDLNNQEILRQLTDLKQSTDTRIRQHFHNGGEATRINLNTDVIGMFETVAAIPAGVPVTPYNQIKIYNNTLYFYDSLGHAWHAAGGSAGSYAGQGLTGGTNGTPFPSGWTNSTIGTGQYVVTHNLGTTNYAVTANAMTAGNFCFINQRNSNDFHLSIQNDSAIPTNDNFLFTLIAS